MATSIADLTPDQAQSIDKLMNLGWVLDRIYSDGLVNMINLHTFNQEVMAFVDQQGNIHPPRTSATMAAAAQISELVHDLKPVR